MIGLGGGSISTYLGRFMPDVAIDTVEIDRRVIETAKTYFGLRETERVRYLDGDGRVFLNRNKDVYDLILVDAYQGGYVPFHLLTKEFYTLVKQRLAPGGAAAFNVHDGTKLYRLDGEDARRGVSRPSTSIPSGQGEVIAVASDAPASRAKAALADARRRCRSATISGSRCRSWCKRRMDEAAVAGGEAARSSPTISRRSISTTRSGGE